MFSRYIYSAWGCLVELPGLMEAGGLPAFPGPLAGQDFLEGQFFLRDQSHRGQKEWISS